MLRIGLTGGIGSGKTLIGSIFRSLSIPVYEADNEARRIMESDPAVVQKINDIFGEQAYVSGTLNRSYIAGIVFRNKQLLERLNAVVHPAVQDDFLVWCQQWERHPYVVEEAAILFESGAANRMDYTIFVKSELETRIERVMKRDAISREEVLARMKNQMDDAVKERLADFVILNENDTLVLPQVIRIHNRLLELKS